METNTKQVIIMRGLPGSGKSTWIKENHPDALICSADHYFYDPKGNYDFNPKLLGQAHRACKGKFSRALDERAPEIVVDNTNTRIPEMEYYFTEATKANYNIHIVEVWYGTPEACARRNVHGVPLDALLRMKQRWEETPSLWEKSDLVTVTRVNAPTG